MSLSYSQKYNYFERFSRFAKIKSHGRRHLWSGYPHDSRVMDLSLDRSTDLCTSTPSFLNIMCRDDDNDQYSWKIQNTPSSCWACRKIIHIHTNVRTHVRRYIHRYVRTGGRTNIHIAYMGQKSIHQCRLSRWIQVKTIIISQGSKFDHKKY